MDQSLEDMRPVYPRWVNRALGVLLRCMKYLELTSFGLAKFRHRCRGDKSLWVLADLLPR